MRRCDDVREFASEPDTYLVGQGYVCFHGDALFGFTLWGDHDEHSLVRLVQVLDEQLAHARTPHISIADLVRLGRFEVGTYVRLAAHIASRADQLAELIAHQVVLRPGGPSGLVISGYFGVERPPYPVSVVGSVEDAVRVTGDARITELLAEVHRVIDELATTSERARVRDLLRTSDLRMEIDAAARALGTSERTLQRRLQDEGTSFRAERLAVQLERARHLLLATDDKVTAIALTVGFASLASFSAAFQKATGESPSDWRERRRR